MPGKRKLLIKKQIAIYPKKKIIFVALMSEQINKMITHLNLCC